MKTPAKIKAAKTSELIAFYNEHNPDAQIKKFSTRSMAEQRCIALLKEIKAVAPKKVKTVAIDAEPEEVKLKQAHYDLLSEISSSPYNDRHSALPSWVWLNTIITKKSEEKTLSDLINAGLIVRNGEKGADEKISITDAGYDEMQNNPLYLAKLKESIESADVPVELVKTNFQAKDLPKYVAPQSLGIAASWADKDVAAARVKRDKVMVTRLDIVPVTVKEFRSTKQAFEFYNLPLGVHIPFRMKLKAEGVRTFVHNDFSYEFEVLK